MSRPLHLDYAHATIGPVEKSVAAASAALFLRLNFNESNVWIKCYFKLSFHI